LLPPYPACVVSRGVRMPLVAGKVIIAMPTHNGSETSDTEIQVTGDSRFQVIAASANSHVGQQQQTLEGLVEDLQFVASSIKLSSLPCIDKSVRREIPRNPATSNAANRRQPP
jgi:hypothetical protein